MKFFLKIAAAAALLVLAGCAELGIRSGVSAQTASAMRKVAVASVLGPTFHGVLQGTTVFGNASYAEDVSAWQIDAEAVRTASEVLGRGAGRTVMPIATPLPAGDVARAVSVARSMGADSLVVVKPTPFDNDRLYAAGYGYFRKSVLGIERDCIYSLFTVEVHDLASGKRVAWEWGFAPMSGIPCSGQEQKIPWQPQFALYSAEQREQLREAVTQIVRTNVETGVRRLGL